jgi:hypothetical protein
MWIKYAVDKNGLVTSFQKISDDVAPQKTREAFTQKNNKPKKEKEVNNEAKQSIYLTKNELKKLDRKIATENAFQIVEKAFFVYFRIWLRDKKGGVIDIVFPREDYVSGGYFDGLEAEIEKDQHNAYRLKPRGRGVKKDIPKKYFPVIENTLLLPVVTGGAKLNDSNHLYGRGKFCEIKDLKYAGAYYDLMDIEIISPGEYPR